MLWRSAGAIGGLLGGLLGFGVPYLLALIETRNSADPTAGAAYSFFPIFTVPLGLIVGGVVGEALKSACNR